MPKQKQNVAPQEGDIRFVQLERELARLITVCYANLAIVSARGLPDPTIQLSSNAHSTLVSTSRDFRKKLEQAIDHLSKNAPNTTRSSTGNFITRFDDLHVVWRPIEDNRILVLTLFEPST